LLWGDSGVSRRAGGEESLQTVTDNAPSMSDGGGEESVTVSGEPTPSPEGGEPPDPGFQGAPDDREMPLADHIEEMVRRLAMVILVMAVVSATTFPFADRLINFLWFSFLPGLPADCPPPGPSLAVSYSPRGPFGVAFQSAFPAFPVDIAVPAPDTVACPRLYHPLSLILARLKVASLVGLVAALPVFVYQTYLFMRPGLYPNERRYYLASVPTSLILASVGLLFAYFLVLPLIFTYFLSYSQPVAEVAFGLSETFGLILLMLGTFAVIFQIPLFVMLALMMGVTNRYWLESRRLYFWAAFAGLAFLFSPDPTGMAPFMVAATMILLFEGTLAMVRWSGEGSLVPGVEQLVDLRPLVWFVAAVAAYLASPAPVPDGYYDRLPQVFIDALAMAGMRPATPIVVGLGLFVAFELVAAVLRRFGAPWRIRRFVGRLRLPYWVLAVIAGSLASPDPALLDVARGTLLEPAAAVGFGVAIVVVYEGGLLLWRRFAP
jgi:sec-independent protein translocase protein TatC